MRILISINLKIYLELIQSKPKLKEYDLAIFRCSDKNRIYHLKIPKYKQSINIDHHQDNTNFGTYNLVLSISSVGEIIYNLYQSLNIKLDHTIATQIYAAICFDTGIFNTQIQHQVHLPSRLNCLNMEYRIIKSANGYLKAKP